MFGGYYCGFDSKTAKGFIANKISLYDNKFVGFTYIISIYNTVFLNNNKNLHAINNFPIVVDVLYGFVSNINIRECHNDVFLCDLCFIILCLLRTFNDIVSTRRKMQVKIGHLRGKLA